MNVEWWNVLPLIGSACWGILASMTWRERQKLIAERLQWRVEFEQALNEDQLRARALCELLELSTTPLVSGPFHVGPTREQTVLLSGEAKRLRITSNVDADLEITSL